MEAAQKAADLDPKLYEAHEQLAYLALEDNDEETAAKQADLALGDLRRSAGRHGDSSVHRFAARQERLALGRSHSQSESGVRRSLLHGWTFLSSSIGAIDEGILAYRKALELNPRLWEARAQLGVNLMRLGKETEARQQLEECYNANYKSYETVNSLRLLDRYKDFVTYQNSHHHSSTE